VRDKYEVVIGLEVHAQLKTHAKIFCGCSTRFGDDPNSNTCPVCLGLPGALPVLNREAVRMAGKAALALGCRISPVSIFARKNYFYPDLPKAYQISQYEQPFSSRGGLEIALKDGSKKRVRIQRVHLEEDAGKLLHAIGSEELEGSLVDFNRGGIPLIEIVSEPDLRSPEEAHAYLAALKEVLQYAEVSRCDMEKGEMRCDVNVSVRPAGSEKFGTRAEIKNVNSFKAVRDAMDYEFRRQVEVLESGGRVVQETRLWDAEKKTTLPMRSKEEAHDYRYFPDPDLVPMAADPAWVSELKASLPELPAARRSRLASQYGLSAYESEVLAGDKDLADYFEAAAKGRSGASLKTLLNLMTTDLLGKLNAAGLPVSSSPVQAESLGGLVDLVERGTLSSKLAKEVLGRMWETGKGPEELVKELGLSQVTDEAQVKAWVEQALASNSGAAEDLRSGKEKAIGAIVGSVMKLSRGKANPGLVNKLIKELVGK